MERVVRCPHCDAINLISTCPRCKRWFVVTQAAIANRVREFDDSPIEYETGEVLLCAFGAAKDRNAPAADAVKAGLAQNTCAVCHVSFLHKGQLHEAT